MTDVINCVACGQKAHVLMPTPMPYKWDGNFREWEPKGFCLHCMHRIGNAYTKLAANNFAGIKLEDSDD
jgi:hypothetical protein